MRYKAGNYIDRLAADLDGFLDFLDKFYDSIMDDERGVGSFYSEIGSSRNDRYKKIFELSRYLTHKGVDKETQAEIDNAVQSFERIGKIDQQLMENNYRGRYPTREMDRIYVFGYQMIKDALERTDGFMQATPNTLAYMGIDISNIQF